MFYSLNKKTVPTSAMRACFQIAECSLFYSKTVPTSAMRACFQIAECSLFYKKGKEVSRRYHSKIANTMKKYIKT